MTREEFSKLFALIRSAFPAQVVTEDTFEAYRLCLEDLEFAKARDAALRVIRTSKFFPTVADIATSAAEASCKVADPPTIMAEVWHAVRTVGFANGPGKLSDCAAYVVQCIGWQTLCDATEDSKMGLNAHILRVAAQYRARAIEGRNFESANLPPAQAVPGLKDVLRLRKIE